MMCMCVHVHVHIHHVHVHVYTCTYNMYVLFVCSVVIHYIFMHSRVLYVHVQVIVPFFF